MSEKNGGEQKPVTFATLKGIKIAKGKKALPRGMKVKIESGFVLFVLPKQEEPVFKIGLKEYAENMLASDGYSFAD